MAEETFPSWRYGPDGAAQVFNSADDVPRGWHDHPSKANRHADGGGEPGDRRASRVELMAELRKRGIQYAPNAGGAELAALLAGPPASVDSNGKVLDTPEPVKDPGPPAEPIPVPFNPPPPLEFAQPPEPPFVAPPVEPLRPAFSRFDHDNSGGDGGSLPDSPPALTGKSKAKLLKIAGNEGALVGKDATNKQIVAAIEAARAEPE